MYIVNGRNSKNSYVKRPLFIYIEIYKEGEVHVRREGKGPKSLTVR